MSARTNAAAALLVTLGILTASPHAQAASDEDACFSAAADGQRERNESHLLRAREAFSTCASVRCDDKVRQRCVAWLADADDALPSLVLAAVDSHGHDLIDVRVFLDGKPIASALEGTAVPVDPGAHVVRFVKSGSPAIDEHVVVRERERGRALRVVFHDELPVSASDRPVPASVFVLGSVGVAAAGVATFFAVSGLGDRASFDCDRGCTHAEASSVSRKLLIADVSAGVALVGLGLATWLYLVRPLSATDRAVVVSGQASPYGGVATMTARF